MIDKPLEGAKIAVWFSCGAASAVAAKKTVEIYGAENNIIIVNNPVAEEDEDNKRFLKDVEKWIGLPIVFAKNRRYPDCSAVDVWENNGYMSGTKGAKCTKELKKEARRQFCVNNHIDYHVFGFTADEKSRHEKLVKYDIPNVLPVLIDLGITKKDCFSIIQHAGIQLPNMYKMGYPNANCIGCVKATSPSYWNLVRKTHPTIFIQRAQQSRSIGCRLVRYKGKRIFIDELPPDARGNKIKSYECGVLCETFKRAKNE